MPNLSSKRLKVLVVEAEFPNLGRQTERQQDVLCLGRAGAAGARLLARVSTLARTCAANLSRSDCVEWLEPTTPPCVTSWGWDADFRELPGSCGDLPSHGPSVKPPWEVKSKTSPNSLGGVSASGADTRPVPWLPVTSAGFCGQSRTRNAT